MIPRCCFCLAFHNPPAEGVECVHGRWVCRDREGCAGRMRYSVWLDRITGRAA